MRGLSISAEHGHNKKFVTVSHFQPSNPSSGAGGGSDSTGNQAPFTYFSICDKLMFFFSNNLSENPCLAQRNNW